MREQMLNDYLAAIAKSHDHRAKTLQFNVRLGRPTVRNLGFQPLDITSQFLDERLTLVAVTNYFDPAVHLTRVSCDGSSLFCEEVATIRGVQGGKDEYHRMFFQDVDTVKGTNRLDTVNFDANGLWVSRNGLPEMLHIHPPKSEAFKWQYGELVQFPKDNRPDSWILCRRLMADDSLLCLEGTRGNEHLSMANYWLDGTGIRKDCRIDLGEDKPPPFAHGFTVHPMNPHEYWFLTRRKAPPQKRGIYRWNHRDGLKRIVPNIWGSGLCFLANGHMLVVRYGLDDPGLFDGKPGALIHVPAAMLRG